MPDKELNIGTTLNFTDRNSIPEQEDTTKRIRINPNSIKKRPANVERVPVKPDELIKKTTPNKPTTNVITTAMNDMVEAVERKRQEVIDFNSNAVIEDSINRENVDEGLEEVSGEITYRVDDIREQKRKENEKPVEVDEVDADIESQVAEATEEHVADIQYAKVAEDKYAQENTIEEEAEEMVEKMKQVAREHDIEFVEEKEDPADDFSDLEEETVEEEEVKEEPVQEVKEEEPAKEEAKQPEKVVSRTDLVSGSIKIMSPAKDVAVQDAAVVSTASKKDLDLDEKDFGDIDEEEENDDKDNGVLTQKQIDDIWKERETALKSEIMQKIVNAGKKHNTNPMVISNKVIQLKDVLKAVPQEEEPVTSWPLTYSGRLFKATALKGHEINLLSEMDDFERNGTLLTMQQANIIYKHDANPNKPITVESWAKTIPYMDVDNMFAALYAASLKDSNYIPIICQKPECQFAKLSENLPIDKFYSFKNDKAKERFETIKKAPVVADDSNSYESVINKINDRFAVGIKLPSIYTILYEYGSLNTEFIRKYVTITTIINYIDYIYFIDDNGNTHPIEWKTYPGDANKTFRSKIQTYKKIIDLFNDVEFSVLMSLINAASTSSNEDYEVTYKIPEFKCDKCGETIPEQVISPRGLLFMRQRLVALATGSEEK